MIRQAVILCGGFGSRLGALATDTPKPLLLVGGIPFLDVLLFELARHSVTRVLLLAGFAAQRMVEYAVSTPLKARFGLEIEVSIEPQRAGTGGAVWHARDRLDDRFFLLNGDSWFDINLLELAGRVIDEPSAAGAIAVRPLPDASRYGVPRPPGPPRKRAGQRRRLCVSKYLDRLARSLLLARERRLPVACPRRKALGGPVRGLLHRYRGSRRVCPRAVRGSTPATAPGRISRQRRRA